jgi:hypothetical protein
MKFITHIPQPLLFHPTPPPPHPVSTTGLSILLDTFLSHILRVTDHGLWLYKPKVMLQTSFASFRPAEYWSGRPEAARFYSKSCSSLAPKQNTYTTLPCHSACRTSATHVKFFTGQKVTNDLYNSCIKYLNVFLRPSRCVTRRCISKTPYMWVVYFCFPLLFLHGKNVKYHDIFAFLALLYTEPIDSHEKSVTKYQCTLRNVPEQRRYHLDRSGSLKSRISDTNWTEACEDPRTHSFVWRQNSHSS